MTRLAQALQDHCRQKLAAFKYPRWLEFRRELPKTATGKIQRFKLRAEGAAALSFVFNVSSGGASHENTLLAGCAAARRVAAAPSVAQQKTVKIGFVSSFSGPTAVIGNDMRNSFELALDHLGRKIGGLPVEVIYEDDQKPEVGKQKTEKLIESDKVDFIVGYIWSNVLLASLKPVVDSKTIT